MKSFFLFLALFVLVLECYGDPRFRFRFRKSYGSRRRRYSTGCRYGYKVNCIVSSWQSWGSCSEDCGTTGLRRRTRHIIRPAKCNGKPCPSLIQEQACNRKCYNGGTPESGYCSCSQGFSGKCCEKGKSQGYGFCSSKQDGVYGNPKDCTSFYHCANGQTRLKYCTHGLHWNERSKTCDWPEDAKCGKVDGAFSEWTTWSKCSATCNKGRQFRLRRCNNPPPSNGGKDCHGSAMQMRDCILRQCQGNCAWDKWGAWSECSTKCGCGLKRRTRKCSCSGGGGYDKKRTYYGHYHHCNGKSVEEANCNCHECPGGNVKTESIGCFCDKNAPNRALPDFVAKFHGSTSAKHKISACAHLAKKLQVEYFGMQDGGECWVDRSGVNAYSKHGKSSKCKDGIGGGWANYVYRIVQ